MTGSKTSVLHFLRNFWLIAFILLLLLRLPSLFEPYWYGDEGIYLVLGQAVRRGLVLYRDIHDNKPPLLYYLAALGQTVFGFRLLLLLVMIPTVYYFYRLALQLIGRVRLVKVVTLLFIVLSSIPLIEGHIANAEIFMVLPTILGVYLVLKGTSYSHYLWAGFLLGLAFMIKVPVFVEAGFLGLWLLSGSVSLNSRPYFSWPKFKTGLSLAGIMLFGFLLPVVILALYYYLLGALPQFLNAALFQNFGYLSSWATGSHSGTATESGLMVRALVLLVAWIGLFIAHSLFKLDKKLFFTAAWFAATLFGATLSTRPYPHYLIQVLPPLIILVGFLLCSPIKNRIIPLVAIASLAFVIVRYHFYFYPTLSYYRNFYSYLIGQKSQQDYRRFFGRRVNQNYQIADYLSKTLKPDDRLFVWGDEPYLYALTDRLPAGRFTVAYHVVDFKAHDETIQKLKAWTPKAIVVYPMSGRNYPQLAELINNYYTIDRQIGDAYIFLFP